MQEFHNTTNITYHFKSPKEFLTNDGQYLDFGGFYVNGQRSGFGILVWPGTKRRYYEGNFEDGKIDGENVKLWGRAKHCVFEGTIRSGLNEGHCIVSDQNGKTIYQGIFIGGLEEGRGLKIKDYTGRLKFEGARVGGKCDGLCKVYEAGVLVN